MPLAQVHFPKFFGPGCAPVRVLVLSALVFSATLLLAACSSPKTVAVPAANPGPAVVEAAGRSNPARSDPGVQSDPFVAAVRAGTMSGYPQATIGQAFEAAFSDTHWQSQQPKGGVHVVTFTGFLPANMRRDCIAAKAGVPASPCARDAKVTFEWTFASDGHLFHLSHVDPESWPETHRSTRDMLLFIYG
jgi:hypothetical protein